MKPKGDGCYSVTRDEFLADMRGGAVLRLGKFGPYYSLGSWTNHRECHPRRDVVDRAIADGTLERSDDANEVQRSCGLDTYRYAGTAA